MLFASEYKLEKLTHFFLFNLQNVFIIFILYILFSKVFKRMKYEKKVERNRSQGRSTSQVKIPRENKCVFSKRKEEREGVRRYEEQLKWRACMKTMDASERKCIRRVNFKLSEILYSSLHQPHIHVPLYGYSFLRVSVCQPLQS